MKLKSLALAAATLLACTACGDITTKEPDGYEPVAGDLGSHTFPVEWWYLSGYLPEHNVAFHWAQFQRRSSEYPVPGYVSHLMFTDLTTGKVTFMEQEPGLGLANGKPLTISHGKWSLTTSGINQYKLNAGPLQLTLRPQKDLVIQPPGYSGSAEVGKMFYQNITRMGLTGTINGKPVNGIGWFDHQWGFQAPARTALWDWFSIQLAGGDDLVVYHVTDMKQNTVQLFGNIVDKEGKVRTVKNVRIEGKDPWTSPTSGYTYKTNWRLTSDEFDFDVRAVRAEQELLSKVSNVAYWEGPINISGTYKGQPETGKGMMELVAGLVDKAPNLAPAVPTPAP